MSFDCYSRGIMIPFIGTVVLISDTQLNKLSTLFFYSMPIFFCEYLKLNWLGDPRHLEPLFGKSPTRLINLTKIYRQRKKNGSRRLSNMEKLLFLNVYFNLDQWKKNFPLVFQFEKIKFTDFTDKSFSKYLRSSKKRNNPFNVIS